MKKRLLTLCCLALPLSAVAEKIEKTFSAQGLKTILVHTGSGNIRVAVKEGPDVKVEISADDFSKCDLTAAVKGDALILSAQGKRTRRFWNSSSCAPSYEIRTPKQLALDAFSGSGDIQIQGLTGAVRAKTGSGDVAGDAPSKDVSLKTGSGTLAFKGLLGSADARTGSGDVALEWAQAPKGNVLARTGSGDVALIFPKNARLKTNIRTGSGEIVNELGDATDAELSVSVKTGSGDVAVRKRD